MRVKIDTYKDREIHVDKMDKTLYLIYELEFDEEKIKNNLNLNFTIIEKYSKNHAIIKLNNSIYFFLPGSRMMKFIEEEKVTIKFIYHKEILISTLKDLEFNHFYYNIGGKPSEPIEAEIGEKEICTIFQNTFIKEVIKINSEFEIIKEQFKKRYPQVHKYVLDLSFNSAIYYPQNKNDEVNYPIFLKHQNEFIKFLYTNKNILYLSGPKGTSKSLFLLNYCFEFNLVNKYPLLYINYREIANLTPNEKINIFKKEMIYLFFDEKTLEYFYKLKPYEGIKTKSLIYFLYDFISNLLKIYVDIFKKKILFAIDNFDEDDEKEVGYLKNIIDLCKKPLNEYKIKLIISGRCKFIYKMQNLYLNNELGFKEVFLYYNIELNKKRDKNSLFLFKFKKFKDKNNVENEILDEEKIFCNKFNLYGMYYSLLQNGRELKIEDLNKNYDILPIDYLVFNKEEKGIKNTYTFYFHNEIYKSAIKEAIKIKFEENNLECILKELNHSQITFRLLEEKFLTLFISYNKLGIINLSFKEQNKLEVNELNKFKLSCYNKVETKIDLFSPIIITQENHRGPNYDLLILLPSIRFTFDAYFIQIGIDINENKIKEIENDLNDNFQNYKTGIKKFIGFDITNIKLVFILDKDTQMKKINKNFYNNYFSSAKYCLDKQILFYLFSVEDCMLYTTSDMIIFNKVKYFGKKAFVQKSNYNSKFRKNIEILLDFDEIASINALIDDDINEYSTIEMSHEKIGKTIKDFNMKFDKENIYIFQNFTKKMFVIRNKYYIMENNKLKEMKDTKNNIYINNLKYDEIITIKKKNNCEEKKIFKGMKRLKKK